MAKSQETFGKKEKEKKKAQKKKEKVERREERKANNNKGKDLDAMMAYLDEDGNISSTPPDPTKKKVFKQEDIEISIAKQAKTKNEAVRKGIVTFFNVDKGYGFITDLQSQENIFVHVNQLSEPIKERDKVFFETEKGPKGLNAVRVKKVV